MRDRDKLRRVKRANEVQAETLDEYRNTIKFLELKLLRLETEIDQANNKYNEEDMDNYAEYCTTHILTSQTGHPYLSAKKWFEKFKKK